MFGRRAVSVFPPRRVCLSVRPQCRLNVRPPRRVCLSAAPCLPVSPTPVLTECWPPRRVCISAAPCLSVSPSPVLTECWPPHRVRSAAAPCLSPRRAVSICLFAALCLSVCPMHRVCLSAPSLDCLSAICPQFLPNKVNLILAVKKFHLSRNWCGQIAGCPLVTGFKFGLLWLDYLVKFTNLFKTINHRIFCYYGQL